MKKIVVVGSINQDVTLHMENLPLPGETVIANGLKSSLGGKGANQAVAAARMGADVAFIGAIGNDKGSDIIIDKLNEDTIDTSGIIRLEEPTGSAYISVDSAAENNIIVYPGANFAIDKSHLYEHIDIFKASDYCLLQLEIPMEIIKEVIKICNQNSVKVILNPAPYNAEIDDYILNNIDFYIPNEIEFLTTLGENTNTSYSVEWFREQGVIFSNKYDLTLIITLGSQGAVLVKGDTATHIPAQKVVPVDTTAAGDSFIGGFLAHLADGNEIHDSLVFGSKVAASTISKYGAISAIPYKNDII